MLSLNKSIIKQTAEYIEQNELCTHNDRILLAVSGGVDSMVMTRILLSLDYQVAIAHCNFKLRKKASDKDQAFVSTYAQIWKTPFFSKDFDTKEHAKKNKLNIQEAARNLRYTWFSEIMEENDYNLLAVAHHMDDQIETVLMNIARGTGIFGLQGMQPKRDHIIRPILFLKKRQVRAFAKSEGILYRQDRSNKKSKYRRNYIRNKLIPKIEKQLPFFKKRMQENILIWQKSARLLRGFLDQQIAERKKINQDSIVLELDKIEDSLRDLVAFEWLRTYGFNFSQVEQMVRCVNENKSGPIFHSHYNRVTVDRKKLVLSSVELDQAIEIVINSPDEVVSLPAGKLELKLLSNPPKEFRLDQSTAFLDAKKLSFPLFLRHWKNGDSFYPLGLKGKKQKLKKYFANEKLNRFEKERVWLLTHDEKICWIVGMRIDERYKVTDETRYTLRLKWTVDNPS